MPNSPEKATGKEQSITITGASTLNEKDVERMVKDAEAHAEADRKRREQIDTKNLADSLAYQAEKQLKDLGDKVPAADKSRVEGLVTDLRQAIDQENYDRIKALTNELQQALMKIGSAIYSQAQGNGNGTTTSSSSSKNDVIDADFVESK